MKDLLRYNVIFTILMSVLCFSGCKEVTPSGNIKTETGNALGTTYAIKYEPRDTAINLKKELETLFNQVNTSMSTYLPESDISRINNGDTTVVTDVHFKTVYQKAREVWERSDGKFDPTVGALVNAWGFGPEKALKKITQPQIDSMLQFTGFDKITLTDDGRITKQHKAIYLDFNALAKGYTIDLIGHMFDEKNIENYLIELGGEILTRGINSQTGKTWRVAIDDPKQKENERTLIARANLKDNAMATSGNYRKFRID